MDRDKGQVVPGWGVARVSVSENGLQPEPEQSPPDSALGRTLSIPTPREISEEASEDTSAAAIQQGYR